MVLHPSAFIYGFEHHSIYFLHPLNWNKKHGPGCSYNSKNHYIKEQLCKHKLTLGQIRLIR